MKYVIWLIVLFIGAWLESIVPEGARYITGFIFGCISFAIYTWDD